MRIVINGIGIAGPTLAYWLSEAGHDVLLVEDAPALRTGGYLIDFWGTGYDIAERMALLPCIRELGYQVREVRFVDRRGRRTGGFSTDVIRRLTNGRFTSLRRSDLSGAVYNRLHGQVQTMFRESITSFQEGSDSARVHFRRAMPRDVDLLIGADGLHSAVRRLVFGPQAEFEVPLGYHVAAFEVTGYRPRDELVYVSHGVPGRQVSRFAMRDNKTLFLFIFSDEYLPSQTSVTVVDVASTLKEVFATVGWECQAILEAMPDVTDIYYDRVSQIRMESWTQGRAALIGDAAACVSLLAGEGSGLAMTEAYVLAQALRDCRDDRFEAFKRYEECLMPLLRRKQRSASTFASSFVPKTALGISFRNVVTRLLGIPIVADFFVGRDLRDRFDLQTCRSSRSAT